MEKSKDSAGVHFQDGVIVPHLFHLLETAIVSKCASVKIGKVMLNEVNGGDMVVVLEMASICSSLDIIAPVES